MTYIPKNRIKTNLYSNRKLAYKSTNEIYTGHYYKLSTGKIFTGKNQYDGANLELIENAQPAEPPTGIEELTVNAKSSNITNYNYSVIKGINVNEDNKLDIVNINPKPTEDDYKIGLFIRYFLVKINENVFIEITKDVYEQIKARNKSYNWELFIPFKLYWEVSGDRDKAKKTNKNITELTEFRLKRKGLGDYLSFNYLRYYKN